MILGIIELLKKTKHSCCQTTKVLIREQSVISTVPLEVINGGHGQLVHFRRENTNFVVPFAEILDLEAIIS